MEFRELILQRESIRSYDPSKPVAKEVLERICEVGRLAPSAANRQPWKFIIICSDESLKKIKKAYEKDWFHDAPHILAVIGNTLESWVRKSDNRNFIETDLAIALDHLILAAANEGLATCWISNFDPNIAREALHLRTDEVVYGITPLGYPRENFVRKGMKDRKALHDVLVWR